MIVVANTGLDYKLIAIGPLEQSPMSDHDFGDIAVDDENETFYVHETLLVFNGLDSVVKSCRQYPGGNMTATAHHENNQGML